MNTSRSFGVELEMSGPYISRYNDEQYVDIQVYTPMGGYVTHRINVLPGWKVVNDGSCGPEFISPVLRSMAPVIKQIGHITKDYNPSFDNVGLHVHVDATDFDEDDVLRVGRFCRYFDRAIFSFFKDGRIKSGYCSLMKLSNTNMQQKLRAQTLERYRGCNLMSWYRHGTVEFRYSEGHLNVTKLTAMVHFYCAIMDFCKGRDSLNLGCKPSIQEKRKYLLSILSLSNETRDVMMGVK